MKTFDRQKMFIQDWNKPIAAHLKDYSQTNWDWNKIKVSKVFLLPTIQLSESASVGWVERSETHLSQSINVIFF